MNDMDALRSEDWSKVYADVPDAVQTGVEFAFTRIHAREKRRKRAMRALACAACLALFAGGALLSMNLRAAQDAPDRVAAPNVELRALAPEDTVYAARADECFHVRQDCSEAMAEQVELQLKTALEFEKKLCPVCGAHVRLNG